MKTQSPEVDAYIAKAPAYARPILKKIRSLYHKACPQIEESIKWQCPHFDYKGIVGGMAAFKNYATFGFWKQKLLSDPHKLFDASRKAPMAQARFTHLSELPADNILLEYIPRGGGAQRTGSEASCQEKTRPPKRAGCS